MIDYEKLKLAHELADKIKLSKIVYIYSQHDGDEFYLSYPGDDKPIRYNLSNIDDLITKLQEILETNCKYKIGQKVWKLNDEYEPESFVIANAERNSQEKNWYFLDSEAHWWLEEQLYPTRESLIESQIEYWNSLKDKVDPDVIDPCPKCKRKRFSDGMCWHIGCDYKQCEHESDGCRYANPPDFPKNKCKKCGEFY